MFIEIPVNKKQRKALKCLLPRPEKDGSQPKGRPRSLELAHIRRSTRNPRVRRDLNILVKLGLARQEGGEVTPRFALTADGRKILQS